MGPRKKIYTEILPIRLTKKQLGDLDDLANKENEHRAVLARECVLCLLRNSNCYVRKARERRK